jgi:hypothetical protein
VEAKHETAELWLMLKEKLEIVSFVGTIGIGGSDSATTRSTKHWNMSIADAQGMVCGGQVMSRTVYTTLELVLGLIDLLVTMIHVRGTGIGRPTRRKISQVSYTETNNDTPNFTKCPIRFQASHPLKILPPE